MIKQQFYLLHRKTALQAVAFRLRKLAIHKINAYIHEASEITNNISITITADRIKKEQEEEENY
jgi:ABC-type methionine transport system ATPase subunit